MIDLMRFWFFSGFLLGGAAWSVDTLLKGRGIQLRGVWASAMGLTVLSPVLPRLGWFGMSAEAVAADPAPVAAVVESLTATAVQASGLEAATVAGVAWLVVSLALLVGGAFVVARLAGRARSWTQTDIRGETVRLSPDFGPAVVGFRNPVIVLPEGLADSDGVDLDLILRHEREHVRARDPMLLLAGATLAACMPWNLPLLWQAHRLRNAVEEDCDLRVIRSGASPRSYGDLLVRMASRPAGFPFAAAAMSERRSGLRRRLERLRDQKGQTRTAVTALLVVAGAGAIGVWMGMPSPVSWWGDDVRTEVVVRAVPRAPEAPVAPRAVAARTLRQMELRLAEAQKGVELAAQKFREISVEIEQSEGEVRRELEAVQADARAQLTEAQMHLEEVAASLKEVAGKIKEAPVRIDIIAPEADEDGYTITGERIQVRTERNVDDPDRPLVFIDGERFFGDVGDLDPDAVERIEVVKGGAAERLYGDEAENGAVHIYLKAKPSGSGSN